MKIFDPKEARKIAETSSLARVLRTTYNPERPMGNVAYHELGDVVLAWLVGLHVGTNQIVHERNEWLDLAIRKDEPFGADQNGHRTRLHWARAIGGWLEDASNFESEWDSARLHEEARWRWEERPWATNEIVTHGLDDYMAFAYQGGEQAHGYEAGIDKYERWTGKSGPISISKVLKPREFGYALCLHKTARQQFDEEDLYKAGRRMLQVNLQETWLGGGQIIRAATWLKIVYWHSKETLTPLQTILRAYEDMPKVPRPNFIDELTTTSSIECNGNQY